MAAIGRKDVLTTGEVAKICHVAPRTVSKWFDSGKLRGYRIPGSRDRRIPRRQLEAFMRAHGIPLGETNGGTCRVLVVGEEFDKELLKQMRQRSHYEIRSTGNGFEAGLIAQRFRPHVIVLDVASKTEEAVSICRHIKEDSDLQAARVIAVDAKTDPAKRKRLLQQGFDGYLGRPYGAHELAEEIEKATNLIG